MSAAADEPISAIDRQSTMPPLNLVQQGAWCRENRYEIHLPTQNHEILKSAILRIRQTVELPKQIQHNQVSDLVCHPVDGNISNFEWFQYHVESSLCRPDMNGLQCTLTGMFYADCCQTFMQWFPAMGVTCVVDQNLCATIYHLLNNVIVPLAVNANANQGDSS